MPNDPANLSDKVGSNLSDADADADANLQLLKELAAQSQGAGSSQLEIEKLKLQADKVEPEPAKLELQADRAEFKAEKLEFEAGKGGSKCTDHELEAAKAQLKADRLELEAEKTQLRVALAQLKAAPSQLEQLEKLETARSYPEAAKAQAAIDKLEDEKAKLQIKASHLEADKSKLEAAKSQFELSRFGLMFAYKGAVVVFIIGELALVAYGRTRMGRLLDLLTHAQSLAEPAITLLYPLYGSVIAIESTSKADNEQWLAYWILYSFLTLMEMVLQPILEWIPVWYTDTMKLIFAAWLVLPQFRGAAFIYDTFVRQYLKKYAWFGCGAQHKSPNGKGKTKFLDFITPKKGEHES